MTKRQLIDEILERNTTADPGFLARFDDTELGDYLGHLRHVERPRLTGDARRYEKYFRVEVSQAPTEPAPPLSPRLPVAKEKAEESIWHLGRDFDGNDDTLRERVDRFAEQLIDRMTEEGDLPDDDGGLYTEPDGYEDDPTSPENDLSADRDDEHDDEVLQPVSRVGLGGRDNDSWLF